MRTLLPVIFAVAIAGCSANFTPAERDLVRTSAEQELLRVWSAEDSTAVERSDAVNRCFTNGTPIARVVQVLGSNYTGLIPYSAISMDGSKTTRSLEYQFGRRQFISIGTTAGLEENELTGRFTGAGVGETIPLSELEGRVTNGNRVGQQDGPANGSQPIRSETNRTPSAAGSPR